MIPQAFIDELLNRTDIVDVVGRGVALKKAGANYLACCPFHNEKTPSFTVSPDKQFYHCFGCGAHGTALTFLIERDGLNFVEAVENLAQAVGMQVPRADHDALPPREDFAALHAVLKRAARFYHGQLKSSSSAIAYLKQRGITGETAARFRLGYAPNEWQGLGEVFDDYNDRSLLQAGMVIENATGKRFDRFRHRIMFPIQNAKGQIIGFGGRVLGADQPKYMNSPETALFQKGEELYGLFQARASIRSADQVVVVEGYMDVIALVQYGIENVVATLGTATTPAHLKKLMRHTQHIVFCFDGDAAGKAAAWRALENALELLVDQSDLRFLFLPEKHDPDSFVRAYGGAAFLDAARNAVPLSDFLFDTLARRVDLRTTEGHAQFLQSAKPLLEKIKAPMLGLMIRKRAAETAGIEQYQLEREYKLKPVKASPRRRPGSGAIERPMEDRLLQIVLAQPEVVRDVSEDELDALAADAPLLVALGRLIHSSAPDATPVNLAERFAGSAYETRIAALAAPSELWKELGESREAFLGGVAQLRKAALDREIKTLAQNSSMSAEQKMRYNELIKAAAKLGRPPEAVKNSL